MNENHRATIDMTKKRFTYEPTIDWYCCRFMCFKENRSYCELKEDWCRANNCKEQMI